MLANKGQWDEAIACFKKAIELDPKNGLAWENLGLVRRAKGQLDDAIACLKKAIELDPKRVVAWDNLGGARRSKGQWDEAIACYKKVVELQPNSPTARNQLVETERKVAAGDKLVPLLAGRYTPASNQERLDLVEICQGKKLYHTAAGLYATVFAADLELASDLQAGHRYNAACYAALAAAGQGDDSSKLDQKAARTSAEADPRMAPRRPGPANPATRFRQTRRSRRGPAVPPTLAERSRPRRHPRRQCPG